MDRNVSTENNGLRNPHEECQEHYVPAVIILVR